MQARGDAGASTQLSSFFAGMKLDEMLDGESNHPLLATPSPSRHHPHALVPLTIEPCICLSQLSQLNIALTLDPVLPC